MNFKNYTLIDWITVLGMSATVLLMLMYMSGCAHTPTETQSRKCCERLSLHQKQMSQFTRYCKVALFLSRSKPNIIPANVRKNSRTAVDVCKFVFGVENDDDLIAAGDEQEYYRVRSYIILNPSENTFWRRSLPCDPAEHSCEEF